MLCLFALFVSSFGFFGSEKPHLRNGQLRYLFIYVKRIPAAPTTRDSGSSWGFLNLVPRTSVSFGHVVDDFKTSGLPFKYADNCSRRLFSSNLYPLRLQGGKICKNRFLMLIFSCSLPLVNNSSSKTVSGILTWVLWSGFW